MSDNPSWTTISATAASLSMPTRRGQFKWIEVWNSGPDGAWINLTDTAEPGYVNGNIELPAKSSVSIAIDETVSAISEGTSNISTWMRKTSDIPGRS